ncbi:hypothetical protein pippi81_gp021 [Flavobacterium phage vB_FspM_pippi8-1]|uniref:Uncharacterized protein n=2 Tax=Pippivirus TaxID=2843435 RepID=A0A6B9L930_9CAUD|nr:hypothetical protein HWC86_gp21 [Flavobacterium phage vB_FspM_pippi8-1]QHB38532.1 hypothetical protein lotta82_gp021 [Flavobacterium phage vB_FspM_lotta8-2]QHB38585.1 hypothetical protein pippi81_gp021 [Flavobacterium phage vB_FspM_pippi8-1]
MFQCSNSIIIKFKRVNNISKIRASGLFLKWNKSGTTKLFLFQ